MSKSTFSNVVARFTSSTKSKKENEPSRHEERKRLSGTKRDDQPESRGRRSKSQRKGRRGKSEKMQDGNENDMVSSGKSVVAYNYKTHYSRTTASDKGQKNPAYQNERGKGSKELDDISL